MNIPADASPTLCLGRSYDAECSKPGNDVFPPEIPTKKMNVNKFSFKYQIVKSSKDVNDLLDVSGELSLKIKAGVVRVEGKGQYVNECKTEEGKTTLLAVMKCTTVTETIDGSAKPREDVMNPGTHYVRSVTYGAEMVASLKFTTSKKSTKEHIKGSAEGELSAGAVNVGLKAALDKLSAECTDLSDFQIKYFATDLPDKLPVTTDELIELIGGFISRMDGINNGQGVPIMFELQPTEDILPKAISLVKERVEAYELEEIEERFDDLRSAQDLAKAYLENGNEQHDDIIAFLDEAKKVERIFRKAISALGKKDEQKKVEASQDAYVKAIDGNDVDHKFVRQWKKIYSTKTPTTRIKLPEGRDITLVLLGKTGNGKSKTGNRIIGYDNFKASPDAASVTQHCSRGVRKDERCVDVIDTPGVLDTAPVSMMDKAKNTMAYLLKNNETQNMILREVAQMFVMAPDGFHSIVLVVMYGGRFTAEDAQALKMLQGFLGKDATEYMILLLTHGDQAEREAEEKGETVEQTLEKWMKTLPDWVQKFIAEIKGRAILFNNLLRPDKEPEEYKKQLSRLITLIDKMTEGKGPFVHRLTKASRDMLDKQIEAALDQSGVNEELQSLQKREEELKKQHAELEEKEKKRKEEEEEMKRKQKEFENDQMKLKQYKEEMAKEEEERKKQEEEDAKKRKELEDQSKKAEDQRKRLKELIAMISEKTANSQKSGNNPPPSNTGGGGGGGGCYPGSAFFVDLHGRLRRMDSLNVGDQVHVICNRRIRLEPVIAFIHYHPDVMQEFLKITTKKNKVLKITEDHLMFVETMSKATAIAARDVKVGDTVYVKGNYGVEKDAVQSISTAYEKGVYAPVTLSGTILVNDVHTSCYFDVLSHEWSHRAMGVARSVHYVSPWMLQWISGVGQKDGFPGWCRLAHKILTLLD